MAVEEEAQAVAAVERDATEVLAAQAEALAAAAAARKLAPDSRGSRSCRMSIGCSRPSTRACDESSTATSTARDTLVAGVARHLEERVHATAFVSPFFVGPFFHSKSFAH